MFTYTTIIKLHDTDAAGLLFFTSQFKIMHDAYEALLVSLEFPFATLIRKKKYFLPIVHAEADYKSPLFVGDRIRLEVAVKDLGHSSFTLGYTLRNERKKIVGLGKTVHVAIDKKSRAKIPLPSKLRQALRKMARN